MHQQTVQFAESPRSPFRRSRTRRSLSPVDQPVVINRKCESVGSLSAVNVHMSREGLLRVAPIQPLISEVALKPTTPDAVRRMRKRETQKIVKDDKDEATLIELATFPGYYSHYVTPLPHGLNTLQHMTLVTRAQKKFQRMSLFLNYWKNLFYCEPSQDIFNDVFWWYFLYHYQPEQHLQNLMFNRIAENYVSLLTSKTPSRHHDVFFKLYPDVLAQAVYSAYIHAFPTSWNNFDDEFKSELCDIISLWFRGIKTIPENWRQWDLKSLEPGNLMKNISTDDDKIKASLRKGFDFSQLLEEAREMDKLSQDKAINEIKTSMKDTGRRKSLWVPTAVSKLQCPGHLSLTRQPIVGPDFEHCVLNINSGSPLVAHFLQTQGLVYNTGCTCFIQHTAISRLPSKDTPTYCDILKHSVVHAAAVDDQFHKYYSSLKEHMRKHSKQRQQLSQQHDRNMLLLFSYPQEVQRLSNTLAFNILGDQSEKMRREKISSAVKETIQRLQ